VIKAFPGGGDEPRWAQSADGKRDPAAPR
jgi:hypothetical protein